MLDLRLALFRHLQRLPLSFFDRNPIGRLMTRVTNDVDVLNELFTSGVVTVFGDVFALIGIISFYANFATEHCGITPALASGLFVACNYLGGITVNITLGWFQWLSIKNKYWLTKTLAGLSIPLICFVCRPWAFLLASYLFGASRSTRMLVYAPAVKKLSGREDATHYFAMAPLFTLPLSVGLPLANGAVLDRLVFMGGWSYRIVFLAMALFSVVSLIILSRIDSAALQPESRKPAP